ncbi:GMC oxidoreductase [Dothidotthia symphoricarpi CBS 119687]|uniref:GMC oxidoreductase n=1 Tax=Dothidotthia symphoricarpi CBS 119687 TaxID=1392245 RepID=A0A6A6ALP0_9PLEO|nr:GMC oxidoreductase [Dothidotthia symphoricarpi CBS 119687]KAF2132093.1 GMC oxidoreductase [Dothidotthia symphoricarpi CBS 119687]
MLFTKPHVVAWAVALSASGALAHPYFAGKVISNSKDLLTTYDYVIVGGGTSGLTVANRLSENQAITILVIEAGAFDANEDVFTIPGLAGGAIGTKYDWNRTYAPNEALGGREVTINLGKIVGGSSKLNRMVFDRGSKSDYDGWETLGNKGWGWAGLLPYFKKSEKWTPATKEILAEYDIKTNLQFHGDKGYVHSTYSRFFWPLTKNIVRATKALGIAINDQATGNAFGGYYCPHNISPNVTRSSAKEAYYDSAVGRKNYHLITGQQVTRIVTNTTNGNVKVTGIEYASSAGAERRTIKVKKEAILAAGSIHTPQILQVSGIGDPALLASINVPTVVDLPAVGQNFHDHVLLTVVNTITTNLSVSSLLTSNETFAAQAKAQYDASKQGPLTSPTADFLLFLPLTTYSNQSAAIHSLATAGNASASLPASTPAEVAKGYQAQYDLLTAKLLANNAGALEVIWSDGVMVLGLQHPFSRGSVKAASASIFDAPIADSGFLRNPLDVALLREGVRFARKLAAADGIAELAPVEVLPGANVTSDADLDSFVRGTSGTLYHPAGSCKMGSRAEGGVVDAQLKVYGVQGLRVVDASVFPVLPATHIMTTVYSVAEKAAELIRGSK